MSSAENIEPAVTAYIRNVDDSGNGAIRLSFSPDDASTQRSEMVEFLVDKGMNEYEAEEAVTDAYQSGGEVTTGYVNDLEEFAIRVF